MSFYLRHHNSIKTLLPKHLTSGHKSFQDYLSGLFLIPETTNAKRREIHEHSGKTSKTSDARSRAFIATAFPPIEVGQLAGQEVLHTFRGDLFPQFSQTKKSQYQCEVCVPYQKWALKVGSRHASLKSKSANISNIMDGTAILSFSGVVQAYEHYESKAHKEAIKFFQSNDVMKSERKTDDIGPPRKEKVIEDFFKPKMPLN